MVTLRLLTSQDITTIHSLANNQEVSRTSSIPFPCTIKDVTIWLNEHKQAEPSELSYTILYKEVITGLGKAKKINNKTKTAEISYWLGHQYWNLGIGKVAARKMRDLCFEELQLKQLHAHCLEKNNIASKKILERIGFYRDPYRKEIPVEGAFQKLFPDDKWIFFTLSRDKWDSLMKLSNCEANDGRTRRCS